MSTLKTGCSYRKTIGEYRFKRVISGYRIQIYKKKTYDGDLPTRRQEKKNKYFIRIFRPEKYNAYSLFILTILLLDVIFSFNFIRDTYYSPFDGATLVFYHFD